MSILIRARLEAKAQEQMNDLIKKYGGIPEEHQTAMTLRMHFFKTYVLDKPLSDFKTGVEKDWAYVARREYRYDVNVRATCDAAALALVSCMARMYMVKKFIMWPFVPVFLGTYVYRQKSLFILHNKKLFDMCNVGEQYELGFARNVILRQCNDILGRIDF